MQEVASPPPAVGKVYNPGRSRTYAVLAAALATAIFPAHSTSAVATLIAITGADVRQQDRIGIEFLPRAVPLAVRFHVHGAGVVVEKIMDAEPVGDDFPQPGRDEALGDGDGMGYRAERW